MFEVYTETISRLFSSGHHLFSPDSSSNRLVSKQNFIDSRWQPSGLIQWFQPTHQMCLFMCLLAGPGKAGNMNADSTPDHCRETEGDALHPSEGARACSLCPALGWRHYQSRQLGLSQSELGFGALIKSASRCQSRTGFVERAPVNPMRVGLGDVEHPDQRVGVPVVRERL